MLWAVSRAPLAKIQGYKQRMGWSFPWASSSRSDFNSDFDVALTEEQRRAGAFEDNFRESPVWSPPEDVRGPFDAWAATAGTDWATYTRERPGMSAFALQDGAVYHTYSAYARGPDGLWGMYQWLDRTPRERNEGTRPRRPAQLVPPPRRVPPRKRGQQITGRAAYSHPDHPYVDSLHRDTP
jgi:predicted dithiol-disulfide oxidoreductase (DUF899 family)